MSALLDSVGYTDWVLHALIWLPVLGIGLTVWSGENAQRASRSGGPPVVFVLSLGLWWVFDPASGTMQMETTSPWIPQWGINYSLGIDGISLFMVLLTTFSTSIAILGSFNYIKTKRDSLLRADASFRSRCDRCLCNDGRLPFLCLLRAYARTDVLHCWYMGW